MGKTTHCEVLAQNTGLKHLSINEIVKTRECHEGWDEELGCWIVDEDKVSPLHISSNTICVSLEEDESRCRRTECECWCWREQLLDSIEDEVKQGGYIIDWHACDLFPKSWIDLVVVLRVSSETLYDRLTERYASSSSFLSLPFVSLLPHASSGM